MRRLCPSSHACGSTSASSAPAPCLPEEGLAGFEMDDVAFKRQLLRQSRTSVLMMTNGKLGTQAPFAIARADEIGHYILEADAPAEMELRLRRTGATVLRAAPPA